MNTAAWRWSEYRGTAWNGGVAADRGASMICQMDSCARHNRQDRNTRDPYHTDNCGAMLFAEMEERTVSSRATYVFSFQRPLITKKIL